MFSFEEFEVLYLVDDQFDLSFIMIFLNMLYGYIKINEGNCEVVFDYVWGNLFDLWEMKFLLYEIMGFDNDLNDFIEMYMKKV